MGLGTPRKVDEEEDEDSEILNKCCLLDASSGLWVDIPLVGARMS